MNEVPLMCVQYRYDRLRNAVERCGRPATFRVVYDLAGPLMGEAVCGVHVRRYRDRFTQPKKGYIVESLA